MKKRAGPPGSSHIPAFLKGVFPREEEVRT